MSKIVPALEFLKNDIPKAVDQWMQDKPFKSLLQREGVNIDSLIALFDPSEDEAAWAEEYAGAARSNKLQLYRKRIDFLRGSQKEFEEDYDPDVTDVDFMRLLEVPYTDSKYTIDWSIDEMKD